MRKTISVLIVLIMPILFSGCFNEDGDKDNIFYYQPLIYNDIIIWHDTNSIYVYNLTLGKEIKNIKIDQEIVNIDICNKYVYWNQRKEVIDVTETKEFYRYNIENNDIETFNVDGITYLLDVYENYLIYFNPTLTVKD